MIINESISISEQPEAIWDFWLDVSNDIHWRAGIIKAEWTSEPPYGMCSTGEHTHKNMGVMKWEVTRFIDGIGFEFVHTAGGLKGSTAFFEVVSENTGSRVNVRMQVAGPLLMRIMTVFIGGVIRKGIRDDLAKLKEIMEKS